MKSYGGQDDRSGPSVAVVVRASSAIEFGANGRYSREIVDSGFSIISISFRLAGYFQSVNLFSIRLPIRISAQIE